jgi:hypothetical protein
MKTLFTICRLTFIQKKKNISLNVMSSIYKLRFGESKRGARLKLLDKKKPETNKFPGSVALTLQKRTLEDDV